MNTLYQLLGLLGAGLIFFIIYRTIKGRPDQFSKDNINKSFFTMGFLALGLIAFIGILVLILNHA